VWKEIKMFLNLFVWMLFGGVWSGGPFLSHRCCRQMIIMLMMIMM
jgi:hypothetical protein